MVARYGELQICINIAGSFTQAVHSTACSGHGFVLSLHQASCVWRHPDRCGGWPAAVFLHSGLFSTRLTTSIYTSLKSPLPMHDMMSPYDDLMSLLDGISLGFGATGEASYIHFRERCGTPPCVQSSSGNFPHIWVEFVALPFERVQICPVRLTLNISDTQCHLCLPRCIPTSWPHICILCAC